MMKIFVKIIFCFLAFAAHAQEIDFEWKNIMGNSGHTSGLSLVCDTDGYTYASGTFYGTIDIGGASFTSLANADGYLLKLDSLGQLIWSKQFSSENDVQIISLTVDNDNNLVLLGNYKGQVNFDTTIETNNTDTVYSSNMFIAKYSETGNLLWAKNTGGVFYSGNSLAIDLNNDILITGMSIEISLFDAVTPITTIDSIEVWYPGGSYFEYYHPSVAFLSKFSTDGDMIWIKETGGSPQEVITDNVNNVIVTGSFMGDTFFDNVLVPEIGFETSYLAQYSTNGGLNWVKTSGGSANWNSGYGLEVDSENNIYQSGQVLGNDIEFDGSIVVPFGGTDAFLSKYNQMGDLIWYKLIGTPTTMTGNHNFNSGNALTIDDNSDILLIGYFLDSLIFQPSTIVSEGAFDLMLLKYSANGDLLSASQYSDYGWVNGADIDTDINNNIYITGYTTLNHANSSFPSYAFIGKIKDSIPTFPLNVEHGLARNHVLVYPNPSSGLVHLDMSQLQHEKSIEVFAIDGRKVSAIITRNTEITLSIEKPGIYLVLIKTGGAVISKKVIIE